MKYSEVDSAFTSVFLLLLKVNNEEWLNEVASIKEHYKTYGDKLPKELVAQLDALEQRLKG